MLTRRGFAGVASCAICRHSPVLEGPVGDCRRSVGGLAGARIFANVVHGHSEVMAKRLLADDVEAPHGARMAINGSLSKASTQSIPRCVLSWLNSGQSPPAAANVPIFGRLRPETGFDFDCRLKAAALRLLECRSERRSI
jgi:hypothetical protein